MAFWVSYDHLGKLILANLVWALTFLVPAMFGITAFMSREPALIVLIGVPALLLVFGVIMPVTTSGLAYLVKELIDTRDGSFGDMFRGMQLYGRRAIGLGFFYLFAVSCLTSSVWFYAAKLHDTAPWLGYMLSALALWCLVFVGLMGMLVMPALVQKKAGVFATLKLTAALVLDNPMFSLGLAVQFVVVASLSMIVPVLVLFSGSFAVVLASSAYEMLARKYAATQETPETPGKATHPIRPTSRQAAHIEDEQDDYLNRGFRDFMFPWKG